VKPAKFEYDAPGSLEEAWRCCTSMGRTPKVLAGGQSLVRMLNLRLVRPTRIVDINRLSELDYIRETDGHLEIGAMTRESSTEESPAVAIGAPLLSMATAAIGHPAIRNRGTIGGCLAHKDPAAEYPLVLLILEGGGQGGQQPGEPTLSADALLQEWFTTSLEPDEVKWRCGFRAVGPGAASGSRRWPGGTGTSPWQALRRLSRWTRPARPSRRVPDVARPGRFGTLIPKRSDSRS
jgi:CO/xanthine dehydrogenase FAD-binding subunit